MAENGAARRLPFAKMQAIGNDFVIIHDPEDRFDPAWAGFYRWVCDRHFGVGADGVILVKPSAAADLRYVHLNSDGSPAEMCGNGSRCFVWYAHRVLGLDSSLTFEVDGRVVSGGVRGNEVTVELQAPSEVRLRPGLLEEPGLEEGGLAKVGVPHYVLYVPDVGSVDVLGLGRKYRYHPWFPAGTNVDFVQVVSPSELRVRTYERGVEGETLGCGTGAVASFAISRALNKVEPTVELSFPGGRVRVRESSGSLELEGPATLVFQGELLLPREPQEF